MGLTAPGQAALLHRYSFTTDAKDSVGTADGTLVNGATVNGGVLVLNGQQAYLDLPNGLLANLTNITIETWLTDNSSGNWARIYDFGSSSAGENFPIGTGANGTRYMFLTPRSSFGNLRGAYTVTGGGGGEQIVEWTGIPLSPGAPHHVVWASDAATRLGRLYVDGMLVGSNTSVTITPAQLEPTVNNWIGRSQFSADAFLNASIDEFRIYDMALTAQEVEQDFQLGPDLAPQSGPVMITSQPVDLTVVENQPAEFTVGYQGTRPVTFQWFRNGSPVPEGTNDTLHLSSVLLAEDGATFYVALTNLDNGTPGFAISSNAVLSVLGDDAPPEVVSIYNIGTGTVQLVYSEPVDPVSATDVGHYNFASGASVTAVALSMDGLIATLSTTPLTYGQEYSLSVSGILDLAATPNTIAPGTTFTILPVAYTPQDVGGASPALDLQVVTNGFNLTAGGGDIGGASDQFGFAYQRLSGDFDMQVRLQGISAAEGWAKAGWMARETLDPGSRFAAVLATPALPGAFFAGRATTGGLAETIGSFPPGYPNTWLRLERRQDTFTGYASYDGATWTELGSSSLSLSNTLYFGLALSSHTNGQSATVQVRDPGPTLNPTLAVLPADREPLGPCTRRTGLVISEIMSKPADRTDGRNLEFVELYNSNPFFHDISGYRLAGDVDYTFPQGAIIPANGFIVIAANPGDVRAVYGLDDVYGPYLPNLKTSGTLRLRDEQGAILLEIPYDDRAPWPAGAEGTGHSIVLARPSYGEADPRAWSVSEAAGGSPGTYEVYQPSPLRQVVINEILAHTEDPASEDYIELYNRGSQTVDLSGATLSDSPATPKFAIPAGTLIGPGSYINYPQSVLGFGLKAAGDTVYFKNAAATRVLDAVRFEAQADAVSLGRWPDGADDFYPMASQTPGAANGRIKISDVVINELMYNPISKDDDDQYVELHNQGTNDIDLSGWRFVEGITFNFPTNTVLPANGYLVVARNAARLLSRYPSLTPANTLGDFNGRLSHGGERVALTRPEINYTTNDLGLVDTNTLYPVVDEVTYVDGGKWGHWSDGGGSSLELIDARANHRLPSNWADSDESSKSEWTTIEATGLLDNGSSYNNTPIGYAQIGLLDAGESLVDDVEVLPASGGGNLVANPDFENGLTDWSLQGCFSRSSLDPGAGVGGTDALHLRTDNRFFTAANYAECALRSTTLTPGQTATLRFKARWLRGAPEILFRLNGNWLEAAGPMQIPTNLGTPGQPNSRSANAGPAIYGVVHHPSMPAANQDAIVTARAHDPDGLKSLTLRYRIDPSPAYTDVPLRDDGSGGDAVAGDGLFSATIPGQAAGVTVAFIVAASDSRNVPARFPALLNNNAPERECVVRFGEPNPASSFGTYHLWLTQTNVDRWTSLAVLSNEDIDGTLVYGNRVIYNMGARYAGSPYHQGFTSPYGSPCHYNWSMPEDDKLLGHASFNKIHWIGNDIQDDSPTQNNNDATLQREQTANTFLRGLGLPWIYRRYVAVYVNGHRRGQLMEDALRPSVSVPDEYFPNDTDGLLYKFQPWFECAPFPDPSGFIPWENKSWCLFMPYTTTGGEYKKARYRWNYEIRETPDSLNNYTNIFSLVTAATAYADPHYVSNMENLADMDNWLRLVAANHAAGNWDCWGVNNEQNLYGYVSPQHRWTLFMFDMSIVLGNRIAWAPGSNLETINSGDLNWQHIYGPNGNPAFRRLYWASLKKLVNGPMLNTQVDPLLDAKYAAFQANQIGAASPDPIKTWISQARTSISLQVASRDTTAFTLSSASLTTATNAVTLSGAAPLGIDTIRVDGSPWPLRWSNTVNWSLQLPVPPGTNSFSVVGYDRAGNAVPGASNQVTVANTAQPEPPANRVVVNEIMFNPTVPDAEYVELFNTATNTTYDLSGWGFNGLSYIFPAGSSIAPQSYLVLAKNPQAFAAAYGATVPVFDIFDGNLQRNGETLTLTRPATNASPETVVDKVRYESAAPWPTAAGGSPVSSALQLLDPTADNSRVSAWSDGTGWKLYSFTGVPGGSRLLFYLDAPSTLFLDDMELVAESGSSAGTNLLPAGGFETAFGPPWQIQGTNAVPTHQTTAVAHSGSGSLELTFGAAGNVANYIYIDVTGLDPAGRYTLRFWYLPSSSANHIFFRMSSAFRDTVSVRAPEILATPAAANLIVAPVAPYPPLWLNEVLTVNQTGLTDPQGTREPWIELYNSGNSPIALDGFYLSDNYTNLAAWAFPAGAQINPGEFKVVFADGQPGQSTAGELHTSFRLDAQSRALGLSRTVNGAPQLVDYLNFAPLPADHSYGSFPDGQLFDRQEFTIPTPGAANHPAGAPLQVFINEWMAANHSFVQDPADQDAEDWFELYNPGAASADLAGYYLTDDLTDPLKFRIPNGYTVPAHGFLLVWADGETGQNSTNRADLHADFSLNQSGESIGLFAADGSEIDAVTFANQTNNVSQGRYPDGTSSIYFMTSPTPRAANQFSQTGGGPILGGIAILPGGMLSFSFPSVAGQAYRVQYKDDLNEPDWKTLGADETATGPIMTIHTPTGDQPQRFYRIVQVP